MDDVLLSSEKHDWRTPDNVLDLVRLAFDGPIALDPCASPKTEDNFAEENWSTFGVERPWKPYWYANPPYGRELPEWVSKAAYEYNEATSPGILLTPSRTDTKWFNEAFRASSAMCFWKGRIKFVGAENPAPFPSALFYFGDDVERFHSAAKEAGIVIW